MGVKNPLRFACEGLLESDDFLSGDPPFELLSGDPRLELLGRDLLLERRLELLSRDLLLERRLELLSRDLLLERRLELLSRDLLLSSGDPRLLPLDPRNFFSGGLSWLSGDPRLGRFNEG
jgi:hypothetical protein